MGALVAVVLAMATTLFGLAVAMMKGELWKAAPHWLPYALFAASVALYILAVMLAVLHFRRERGGSLPATPSRYNEQRVEANPRQTVYIGSDVLRDRTPSPLPQSTTKPHPELALIDYKATMIGYDRVWGEIDPAHLGPDQWKANAFVAIFQNKPARPGEETTPAYGATAHLIYRNDKGEQQIVEYGTWLGKYEHFSDFKSGSSRALILSSSVTVPNRGDGETYVFENPNKINIFKVPYATSGQVIRGPKTKLLLRECREVEVTIVSGNITLYQGTFRRTVDSGATIWSPVSAR